MHSAEERSLTLVDDFVREIEHALSSLAGKNPNGLIGKYQFWSSKHLHRAADGFAFLRHSGRADASKFLVRPAIEIFFRLEAVKKDSGLFYRIAYSEHLRDKQLLEQADRSNAYNHAQSEEFWKIFRQNWERFRDAFTAEFPNTRKVDKELRIDYTAEKAGLKAFYGSHYRIYCQYTHGALRASFGSLDNVTDREDNRIMAICASAALDTLISLGAASSNRDLLFQQLTALPTPQ